jgi:integrative and conjugative element protein (TIGR02256 family)
VNKAHSNDRTWRSNCGRYTVLADGDCLGQITDYARNALPNETGAVLIGSYSDDGYTARIEDTGPLPPDSKGMPCSFQRGVSGLKGFLSKIFSHSSGKRHYIGEWHSHPGGAPSPSNTDDITLHAICKDVKSDCPETILLLISIFPHRGPRFGVLVYSRHNGKLVLDEIKDNTTK